LVAASGIDPAATTSLIRRTLTAVPFIVAATPPGA
jgi:hypothetical protein